jgi:hypothetical protein
MRVHGEVSRRRILMMLRAASSQCDRKEKKKKQRGPSSSSATFRGLFIHPRLKNNWDLLLGFSFC